MVTNKYIECNNEIMDRARAEARLRMSTRVLFIPKMNETERNGPERSGESEPFRAFVCHPCVAAWLLAAYSGFISHVVRDMLHVQCPSITGFCEGRQNGRQDVQLDVEQPLGESVGTVRGPLQERLFDGHDPGLPGWYDSRAQARPGSLQSILRKGLQGTPRRAADTHFERQDIAFPFFLFY